MVIDAYTRLGESFDRKNGTTEEYGALMEEAGIHRALICPQKPLSYRVEEGNDAVERIMSDNAHLFWGAVRLDPWKGERALRELERRLKTPGFVAAYLNPWEDSFRCSDEAFIELYAQMENLKLPVVIETGYPYVCSVSQLGELARLFPRLRILAANSGQRDLSGIAAEDVRYVLNRYSNVFIGTSAVGSSDLLIALAETEAAGRVIFETGYPFSEPETEKRRIETLSFSRETRKDLCSGSILRFLFGTERGESAGMDDAVEEDTAVHA